MMNYMDIEGSRHIGWGEPVYIVAELSANHNQNFEQAVALIHAAKEAGADAVKLQTYTPDTLTIQSDKEYSVSVEEHFGTVTPFTISTAKPTPPGNGRLNSKRSLMTSG